MKYLFLFILAYIIYRYLKPMLVKKPEDPYVKGQQQPENEGINKNRNIKDADFEEIE